MARFRNLKQDMGRILAQPEWQAQLADMAGVRPERLTGPLLALRLDREELVRWRASEGLGLLAAELAGQRMERARVLMRTFMWYLNEESGNLGWGIPEAMACAMVRQARLAEEYHTILASYVYSDPEMDGNYLDHPELRRGAWWGLARLSGGRPDMVVHAERFLVAGLDEESAFSRGCAAWALGNVKAASARAALEARLEDTAGLTLYRDDQLQDATVAELAREALAALG